MERKWKVCVGHVDTLNNTLNDTLNNVFGSPAPHPLSVDLRRAQCTREHSAREHSGARGLG